MESIPTASMQCFFLHPAADGSIELPHELGIEGRIFTASIYALYIYIYMYNIDMIYSCIHCIYIIYIVYTELYISEH